MNTSPDPSQVAAGMFGVFFLFWLAAIVIGLALTIFWVLELIDVCRREFRDSNTKLLWILVVVLAHGLGALIYYFAGKPQGWLPGEAPMYPPQAAYNYPPSGYQPPASYQPPAMPPDDRQI